MENGGFSLAFWNAHGNWRLRLAFEEAGEFAGFSTSFSEISQDLRIARYPASPPTGNSQFLMSFPEFP